MGAFDSSNEGVVGVDTPVMTVAINNLEDVKTNLTTWNNQLVELRDLVIADWFGGAAEQFTGSYEALAEAMNLMVNCALQLQNTSQDTVDLYTKGDQVVSDQVYAAMRVMG